MAGNTSTTTVDVTNEDYMNSIFILKDGLLNDLLEGKLIEKNIHKNWDN